MHSTVRHRLHRLAIDERHVEGFAFRVVEVTNIKGGILRSLFQIVVARIDEATGIERHLGLSTSFFFVNFLHDVVNFAFEIIVFFVGVISSFTGFFGIAHLTNVVHASKTLLSLITHLHQPLKTNEANDVSRNDELTRRQLRVDVVPDLFGKRSSRHIIAADGIDVFAVVHHAAFGK